MIYSFHSRIYINAFIIILLFPIFISCNRDHNQPKDSECDILLSQIEDSLQTNISYSKKLSFRGIKKSKDSIDKYLFYVLLGKSYYLSYQKDSMNYYVNKALEYAKRYKSEDKRKYDILSSGYEVLANNHYLHRHGDSAILYHKQALETIKKGSKINLLPDISANLADVYLQMEDMPMAAKWYNQSLNYADSLHIKKEKYTSLYMGLAQVYLYLRDYETSKHYYDLAGNSFSILPINLKSYYLNNYGNFFYYTKDYIHALKVFKQLKRLLDLHPDMIYDNYLCRLNIADVFLKLNKPDSTEYYLKGCYEYFNKMNVNEGVYYVNTQNIGIAIQENNMAKIKEILQNEKIADLNNINLKRIRSDYLREYYSNISNYKEAYNILLKNKTEEDSLDFNRNRMRAAEIMMRYHNDTLSLHKQIIIEKKNTEIKKVSLWLIISIVSLLFITSAFAFFFMFYKKKKLQNQLNIFELRLANLRNRISPHFIFNVLNHEVENREKGHDGTELTLLANLLQDSLNMTKQSFVSIADELSFVERYIKLESYIFDNDFTYNIDINLQNKELIYSEKIPTMFIQILAENAIKHGLKNKEGAKKLDIIIYNDNDNIIISVRDNGVGFNLSHSSGNTQVGLNVIRKTLALINNKKKNSIKFYIHNLKDTNNIINGCESTFTIPIGIKLN